MSGPEGDGAPHQIERDLWVLDTLYRNTPGVIAAYLLNGAYGLALIDVGSAATIGQLLRSIEQTGHRPADIAHILVTHVHLDHAGACGALLPFAPNARVYVHPAGAAHLSDPSKLVASAARIYGDQMDALWGTTLPVPAERIQVVEDGTRLSVGDRSLIALHTPGHAIHHMALHDPLRHVVFAGDVAGVALEGSDYVRPPTPPPDLDLEAWSVSIARLSGLRLEQLFLPHFGRVARVADHLRELEARLYEWGEFVLAAMITGKETERITVELAERSEPEVRHATHGSADANILRRYELATNYRMTVQGYERYWRKRHPERLAPTVL